MPPFAHPAWWLGFTILATPCPGLLGEECCIIPLRSVARDHGANRNQAIFCEETVGKKKSLAPKTWNIKKNCTSQKLRLARGRQRLVVQRGSESRNSAFTAPTTFAPPNGAGRVPTVIRRPSSRPSTDRQFRPATHRASAPRLKSLARRRRGPAATAC